jgi:hypothetical protein
MEKECLAYLQGLQDVPPLFRGLVVYADPMDLTKIPDIPPETGVLEGVRETQKLFFQS